MIGPHPSTASDELLFSIVAIIVLFFGVFRLDHLLFRPHHHFPSPPPAGRPRLHYVIEENGDEEHPKPPRN